METIMCTRCQRNPAMLSHISDKRKNSLCSGCKTESIKTHEKQCLNPKCLKRFYGRNRQAYCNASCRCDAQRTGSINSQGYKNIRVNGRKVLEHRHIMEQILKRPLRKGETVHHKNGKRADNRHENLELRAGPHGNGLRAQDLIKEAIAHLRIYKPEELVPELRGLGGNE
jgi:HNH endonuclease